MKTYFGHIELVQVVLEFFQQVEVEIVPKKERRTLPGLRTATF